MLLANRQNHDDSAAVAADPLENIDLARDGLFGPRSDGADRRPRYARKCHRPIRFGRSFRRFSSILSGACASSPLFGSRHMPTQRRSEATQKPYSKTLYQNLDLTYVVAYDRRSIRQPDFLPSGRGYDRALGSGSRNSLIGLGLGLPVTVDEPNSDTRWSLCHTRFARCYQRTHASKQTITGGMAIVTTTAAAAVGTASHTDIVASSSLGVDRSPKEWQTSWR
jgi:hypothetical protein